MKTYLCGGINGLSDADCRDWREVAKSLLQTDTLDPMRRDYRGEEDRSVEGIVVGDIADIDHSDAVLVNATRPSWGTAMEIVIAQRRKVPVVAWVGEGALSRGVSPWLRYFCTSLHETLESACEAINARFFERTKSGAHRVVLYQRGNEPWWKCDKCNAEDAECDECGGTGRADCAQVELRKRLREATNAQFSDGVLRALGEDYR
jgi:hypothetical protein